MTNQSMNPDDCKTFKTGEDTESAPCAQPSAIRLLPNEDPATGGSAEPSLVARMARSDVAGAMLDHLIDPFRQAWPGSMLPDQDVDSDLREGSREAPRSGRVDAAGATYGTNPHTIGAAASGEPVTSVGAGQSRPAETVRSTEFGQPLERGRGEVDETQAHVVRRSPDG